jgi:DNA-binding NarL/FixJ family response regulator
MSSAFGGSVRKPTLREQELIELIGRGFQNKEIANELNISERTVHVHITTILRKYRLHNRTQIAVMFTKDLGNTFPSTRTPHERRET